MRWPRRGLEVGDGESQRWEEGRRARVKKRRRKTEPFLEPI